MMIRNAIGPYQLVRLLGRGGMGEVYLGIAHGASGFSRQVAIKLLAPELTVDPSLEKMLIHEALIGGRIHHRNLVDRHLCCRPGTLDELAAPPRSQLGEGSYYLVLEYVDGGDLAARLHGAPLPEPLALHLAHELALGLHHLHGVRDDRGLPLGIVHRDVRPANVLVSTTGDVKLGDLGIAKVTAFMSYTASGTRKGQYRYMAPEQLAGEPLGAATDQFALGVTLVELLTGHRPYPDGKPWELADLQRAGPDLAGVAEDLRPMILRALSIAPADRFASVDELRHEIVTMQRARPLAGAADVAAWVAHDLRSPG